MSSVAAVVIHPSQHAENVRRDLLSSLRSRRMNHKFLYDGERQTQKWLALHEAHSPARNDPDCAATYDRAFTETAARIEGRRLHLFGLGCGGGQKDARLLKLLQRTGRESFYTPCDVSAAMVLVARDAALAVVPETRCFPFVCDLATADDLPRAFEQQGPPDAARLFTFFGMIPNFEPQLILPKLAGLIRSVDSLLFSANLAPGNDYADGVGRVLPQYDNALTRDWLLTFLLDLGVQPGDGELRFEIEDSADASGLKKIVARYHFVRPRRIERDGEAFEFKPGDNLQLFFSYRYTPALARRALEANHLRVLAQWLTRSEEEGVFLCQRG